jgi:hypothetical protein
MNKRVVGIVLVTLVAMPILCSSTISSTNVNEFEENSSSKSFYLYRCLIIGSVSNYYEDDNYIYFKVVGFGISIEIYSGNPFRPIAIGRINEQGKWEKPINDFFRGVLNPQFIFGVFRV